MLPLFLIYFYIYEQLYNIYTYTTRRVPLSLLVMSNQRFLKIVCFRFPTNIPQKNWIYSFLKENSLSKQNVLFQI
jgi:hypothetical protein